MANAKFKEKIVSGTGDMALWIRCLPCKYGDLHLTSRTHVRKRKPGMVICNCSPSAGEAMTCGSLGFSSQPTQLVRNVNCDTLRKLLDALGCCKGPATPLAEGHVAEVWDSRGGTKQGPGFHPPFCRFGSLIASCLKHLTNTDSRRS